MDDCTEVVYAENLRGRLRQISEDLLPALDTQQKEIELKRRQLEIEANVLCSMLDEVVRIEIGANGAVGSSGKSPPRMALLRYLSKNDGSAASSVVRRLSSEVDSSSDDVRGVLHSTIYHAKKKGLIRRDGGKLFITRSGRELLSP